MRARRKDQRQRRTLKVIALTGGALIVIAALIVWGIVRAANWPGEAVPDMGNLHIEAGTESPVAYNSTPPTSGPHYGNLARWGVHTEPLPDELVVHNLEDGGVGIWYDCPDGCPELVSQLESVAERYHEGVLLAPYPGMGTRIALTAWNRIDRFDEFEEERLERFIRAFRGLDHHVAQ
jgi:hypothetical protein